MLQDLHKFLKAELSLANKSMQTNWGMFNLERKAFTFFLFLVIILSVDDMVINQEMVPLDMP